MDYLQNMIDVKKYVINAIKRADVLSKNDNELHEFRQWATAYLYRGDQTEQSATKAVFSVISLLNNHGISEPITDVYVNRSIAFSAAHAAELLAIAERKYYALEKRAQLLPIAMECLATIGEYSHYRNVGGR